MEYRLSSFGKKLVKILDAIEKLDTWTTNVQSISADGNGPRHFLNARMVGQRARIHRRFIFSQVQQCRNADRSILLLGPAVYAAQSRDESTRRSSERTDSFG